MTDAVVIECHWCGEPEMSNPDCDTCQVMKVPCDGCGAVGSDQGCGRCTCRGCDQEVCENCANSGLCEKCDARINGMVTIRFRD